MHQFLITLATRIIYNSNNLDIMSVTCISPSPSGLWPLIDQLLLAPSCDELHVPLQNTKLSESS